MERILDGIPLSWGPQKEGNGVAATVTTTGPGSIVFTAPAHSFLVLLTPQMNRQVFLNSDKCIAGAVPTGSIEIIPQGSDFTASWGSPKENLFFAFENERMKNLAGAESDDDSIRWEIPALGSIDSKALYLATQLRREIENGDWVPFECIDAWITLLGIHMLRNYTGLARRNPRVLTGGLRPIVKRRIIDYIHANLAEEITIEVLASIACISPSHFIRAFRHSFGMAPYQYIIQHRLELVHKLASQTELPLGEVAYMCGFTHNSHMTSVMKRIWGTTPSAVRRNAKLL